MNQRAQHGARRATAECLQRRVDAFHVDIVQAAIRFGALENVGEMQLDEHVHVALSVLVEGGRWKVEGGGNGDGKEGWGRGQRAAGRGSGMGKTAGWGRRMGQRQRQRKRQRAEAEAGEGNGMGWG